MTDSRTDRSVNPFAEMFENPDAARNYGDGPARFTPGFSDLHKMVNVLIQERAGRDAHLLVHGAGGGLELEALARANPSWHFDGVDPAQAMLDEAAKRIEFAAHRVNLYHGFIDAAPPGPFDAATSLLTLHFLDRGERVETLRKIAERLKSGAPVIVVHSSFPQSEPDRAAWLSRYEGFAIASGVDGEMADNARQAVGSMSTLFEPEEDMQMMRDAGLRSVSQFYRAFTWCGWVGYVG